MFVIGKQGDGDQNVTDINQGDILQLDIVDHYNNLTLKSVGLLKYFATTEWKVNSLVWILKPNRQLHFPF